MKKLIVIALASMVIFSVGFAFAGESRIPKHVQEAFAEQGLNANFFMWFPVVPQMSINKWSNILIVSNFNNNPITVRVWFTTYSQTQTIKEFRLEYYEKLIVPLGGSSGFGDDLYDIYCASDQFFGAAVLLLEDGKIATAWPPIY